MVVVYIFSNPKTAAPNSSPLQTYLTPHKKEYGADEVIHYRLTSLTGRTMKTLSKVHGLRLTSIMDTLVKSIHCNWMFRQKSWNDLTTQETQH